MTIETGANATTTAAKAAVVCFQNQQLEERLVMEYKSKQFIVWGDIYMKVCGFFLLVNVGAAISIDGARFSGSLVSVVYGTFILIRQKADKIQDKEKGRHFFGRGFSVVFALTHITMVFNDDLTDNQTYGVGVFVLGLNFMLFFYLRVSSTPDQYRHFCIALALICFYVSPCCDVFGPYEPLLFLAAMAAGEAFGHTIDAPHLTIFVLTQMGNLARIDEERNKAKAAEAIIAFQAVAAKERDEREKAEKHADSMLNHNLKNIMADGIASVELYELTSSVENLLNAKLSMKRGMVWTRLRQSIIMVCDGTYQLQKQKTTAHNLVWECISGRDVEAALTNFPPNLLVDIDPMLVGLALENGVSNAIKYSPPGKGRPRIICELLLSDNNKNTNKNEDAAGGTLQLIIQNKATPGVPFIDEERETELFRIGTHGKGTEGSSDGIGLGHAVMAAAALGGKVSLRQSGDTISYTLSAPVTIHRNERKKKQQPQAIGVDANNEENHRGSTTTVGPAPKKNEAKRGMLIDDSLIARKFADRIMMPKILGLQNWIVLGETPQQVEQSIPMALAMSVDIIIIDENLDYNTGLSISGSDVCASMIKAGVQALFCIRSGNTSPDDVKKYIDAGAHCIICKSFNNQSLAKPLHDGFRTLKEERAAGNEKVSTAFPILLLD